jgi:hypothetical protein
VAIEKAAVRCRKCGSIEIRIVDTSATEEGTYHGAVCPNGHRLILLTVLLRHAKSTRVRRRFPPSRRPVDDSDNPLTG